MQSRKKLIWWILGVLLAILFVFAMGPFVDGWHRKGRIEETGAEAVGIFYNGASLVNLADERAWVDYSPMLQELSQIRGVTTLDLRGAHFDSRLLINFSELRSLSLGKCGIQDSDLDNIAKCSRLEFLSVFGSQRITPKGLLILKGMPNLEYLALPFMDDSAESRQILTELVKSLPKLRTVCLPKRGPGTSLLEHLKSVFPQIEWKPF